MKLKLKATVKTSNPKENKECEDCKGSGKSGTGKQCPACHGSGKLGYK